MTPDTKVRQFNNHIYFASFNLLKANSIIQTALIIPRRLINIKLVLNAKNMFLIFSSSSDGSNPQLGLHAWVVILFESPDKPITT